MNVSFDFDGTLTKKSVYDFAHYCIEQGLRIWIVTSRYGPITDDYNKELLRMSEKLEVNQERIIFTSGGLKKDYFRQFPDFIFHLDDDWIELHEIKLHTDIKAIACFGNTDWEQDCFNAIQEYKFKIQES